MQASIFYGLIMPITNLLAIAALSFALYKAERKVKQLRAQLEALKGVKE